MKLWDKGYDLDREIERYTVGDDPELDRHLAPYDCAASIAHARMLEKAGVLTPAETRSLVAVLEELRSVAEAGDFVIRPEEEDCHTALENRLVEKLGEVGRKIHAARSRNDQVQGALRLYMKDRLRETGAGIEGFRAALARRIERDGEVRFPGYSHARKAMPASVSLWLGAFAESMEDNAEVLAAAQRLIDQSPLGSGAGYGIPVIEIDRGLAAEALGFARVQNNPLYVQNSRGKFEATVVSGLVNVMADLARLSSDLILFTMDEVGFFSLPREFCTGSSIMPQKMNPDVLELVRARYHEVVARELQIRSATANLISGYHRDLQTTKRPLMESFEITGSSLRVVTRLTDGLVVNRAACERALTDEIYSTERVYELVKKGVPFRDAYRKIASRPD